MQRKYSAIFTEPEVINCFSIIFRGEYEELEENGAKHEEQMWHNSAIMPRLILLLYLIRVCKYSRFGVFYTKLFQLTPVRL